MSFKETLDVTTDEFDLFIFFVRNSRHTDLRYSLSEEMWTRDALKACSILGG